jgi:hypothetical protein
MDPVIILLQIIGNVVGFYCGFTVYEKLKECNKKPEKEENIPRKPIRVTSLVKPINLKNNIPFTRYTVENLL